MADLEFKQGDYGDEITITVQTASSAIYDLTSKVVTFKMWQNNPYTLVASASCTVATPATGVAVYTTQSTATLFDGLFSCELEMTEAGKKTSTKTYSVLVKPSP